MEMEDGNQLQEFLVFGAEIWSHHFLAEVIRIWLFALQL